MVFNSRYRVSCVGALVGLVFLGTACTHIDSLTDPVHLDTVGVIQVEDTLRYSSGFTAEASIDGSQLPGLRGVSGEVVEYKMGADLLRLDVSLVINYVRRDEPFSLEYIGFTIKGLKPGSQIPFNAQSASISDSLHVGVVKRIVEVVERRVDSLVQRFVVRYDGVGEADSVEDKVITHIYRDGVFFRADTSFIRYPIVGPPPWPQEREIDLYTLLIERSEVNLYSFMHASSTRGGVGGSVTHFQDLLTRGFNLRIESTDIPDPSIRSAISPLFLQLTY